MALGVQRLVLEPHLILKSYPDFVLHTPPIHLHTDDLNIMHFQHFRLFLLSVVLAATAFALPSSQGEWQVSTQVKECVHLI